MAFGLNCFKEEKHDKYILFEQLSLQDIPEPIRHQSVLDYIYYRGKMVVKILIPYSSSGRETDSKSQTSRVASGYACICDAETVEFDCPVPKCPFSALPHKVYGGIFVTTNKHVIHDELETKLSEFHFFYESRTPSSVIGHGYLLRDDSDGRDYAGIKIYLHDANIVEQVRRFAAEAVTAWDTIPPDLQEEFKQHTVITSHPHGWPKRVSFGKLLEKEVSKDDNSNKRYSTYTSLTCQGSSGSPVLTTFYWNKPFVHSKGRREQVDGEFVGVSYF